MSVDTSRDYCLRRFDKLTVVYRFIFPPVFPSVPCCHSARFSHHWSAFGRFFKIRFERFDRSPSSIMPTYLYPTEVPTNVSFRSECSRCLLSKTERWLTIFLDWYVFEPNVKSNLTLALSSSLSFIPSLFSGNDHEQSPYHPLPQWVIHFNKNSVDRMVVNTGS